MSQEKPPAVVVDNGRPTVEIDLAGTTLTEQDLRRILAKAYAVRDHLSVNLIIRRVSIEAIPAVFLTY